MPASDHSDTLALFKATLSQCRELYISSGRLCAREYPHLIDKSGDDFVQLMDDLHRALVLKVYVSVCEADRKWSNDERLLAEVLFEHLWGQSLEGEKLATAARQAAKEVSKLPCYSLVRPFDRIVPLRDRVGTLMTLVMRLANIIARADGEVGEAEAGVIKSIQQELQLHLRSVPIDEPTQHDEPNAVSGQAIQAVQKEAHEIRAATRAAQASQPDAAKGQTPTAVRPSLADALAELDGLIGLDEIKQEVRTLTNYLKLQMRRGEAGLPDTDMSLHMVFTGNPGTGKTMVARILGKIFGAMGVLKKGHLVETDRSGLVAEYMGQTGAKTQAKINEALDGVLFIDEAYSLLAQEGQDVYGGEAIQALLKRAEDDRQRLVIILAGYPDEMQALLESNPGLSSRFNRVMHFDDYLPVELARIFAWLCHKNHYELAPASRAKLMIGLTEVYLHRDRHFGNGRAVRNIFEKAIRRMANRIADIPKLSPEQLTRLEADDVQLDSLPPGFVFDPSDSGPWRFRITCPHCSHVSKSRGSFLGQKVRCPRCQKDFIAEWGDAVSSETSKDS
jgi:uncharacterized tellurite resistance protein B-like protein